jgi:hypothetical protein
MWWLLGFLIFSVLLGLAIGRGIRLADEREGTTSDV